MSRIRERAWRRRLHAWAVPTAALLLCAWATSFPAEAHEAMAAEILEAVATGKVTIDGEDYAIDEEVRQAIADHPAYFRAGAFGPDVFPDVALGASYIHANSRCPDVGPADACADAPGRTYAYQWLDLVYRRGWAYYDSLGGNGDGQKALAFTYGFLAHAAGDVWAHTFVNDLARGAYPERAEILGSDSARLVAVRHVVVEGYIAQRSPHSTMPLALPHDFIYSTFITDPEARRLGNEYLYARLMRLRDHLQQQRDAIPSKAPRGCVSVHSPTGKCLEWVARGAITWYLDTWIASIDRGLREWPHMSEDVAVDLLQFHSLSKADARVTDFATHRLAPMIAGPPGSVAQLYDEVGDAVWKGSPEFTFPPVQELKEYIFRQATGMTPSELKSYQTAPESWLARPELRFSGNVRSTLDSLMALQADGTFSPSGFAPYRNAVVLAELALLPPEEIHRLVARYGVHGVYDITDAAHSTNPMIGWIRSLDAGRQWRAGAPGAPGAEGMPLWHDCDARVLMFRRLFVDWEHASGFPDDDDPCVAPARPPLQPLPAH